jgi:hypothetical protein
MALLVPQPGQKTSSHGVAIYHIKGSPAKLLGHVEAPDEESAIRLAIEE